MALCHGLVLCLEEFPGIRQGNDKASPLQALKRRVAVRASLPSEFRKISNRRRCGWQSVASHFTINCQNKENTFWLIHHLRLKIYCFYHDQIQYILHVFIFCLAQYKSIHCFTISFDKGPFILFNNSYDFTIKSHFLIGHTLTH